MSLTSDIEGAIKNGDLTKNEVSEIIDSILIGFGFKELKSQQPVFVPEDAIFEYISKNPIQAIDTALEELVFDDKITTLEYSNIIRTVKGENKSTESVSMHVDIDEGVTGGIMQQATGKSTADSDYEPKIEIVDGHKQFVIPGIDEVAPKNGGMPEDDDF